MLKSRICVRQHDISDCGAACLATVARVHGLAISLAKAREYTETDRHGATALGIVEAARQLGFEAKGVKGDIKALEHVPLPCIAHVIIGGLLHYVVIHKVTEKQIKVADPAQGIVKHTRHGFSRIWSGVLILLNPGKSFQAGCRKVSVWRRFGYLLASHRFLLFEALLATLFFMLLGLGASIYIQLLVDKVLIERDWIALRWLSLALLFVVICRTAFGTLRGLLLAYMSRKVDVSLMIEYYRHVLRLPMRFFETRQTGEIVSRLNDVVKIREAISGSTLVLLVDTATMIGGFGILCFYNVRLALTSLTIVPIIIFIVYIINQPLRRAQRATLAGAAALQSHLVENLMGIMTLKAFSAEKTSESAAKMKVIVLLRSLFRATVLGLSTNAASDVIAAMAMVFVLFSAGSMVIRQEMTIGQMVAFQSVLLYLLQPLLRLAGINQTVQDAVVAADRLGEILDLSVESNEELERIALPANIQGKIEYRQVSFRYGARAPVLCDINISVPPQSYLALVGESGSGKTTLAKLLLRYYDPFAGQITIDGMDLHTLQLDTLRAQIGYVDQDPFLFSGTIEDNLLMGKACTDVNDLNQAIRTAGLEEFIASLPHGRHTYIGERGVTLSSGQRQRLAIVRVLLQDPKILIFDEATNNLDSISEIAILKVINRLRKSKTVITIGHRLSTAQRADQIIVLGNGRILERGTHQELLRAGGPYCSLWKAQYLAADPAIYSEGAMTISGAEA